MKILFTLILTLFVLQSFAQTSSATGDAASGTLQSLPAITEKQNTPLPDTISKEVFRKNVVKINLTSLALFNNYSFSYERSITRKITFVAGYSFVPEASLASKYLVEKHTPSIEQAVESYIGEEVDIMNYLNLANVGSSSVTGEIRFYGGAKPGARGFYLSLYGRYMNFKAKYPYEYKTTENRTYTLPFDGTIKGYGGGAMLGYQLMIANRLTMDLFILGGHYGKMKIDMPAIADLSTMTPGEKSGLQEDVESVNGSTNGKIDVKASVSDQGVILEGSAPFVGIRSLVFSLGLAF